MQMRGHKKRNHHYTAWADKDDATLLSLSDPVSTHKANIIIFFTRRQKNRCINMCCQVYRSTVVLQNTRAMKTISVQS